MILVKRNDKSYQRYAHNMAVHNGEINELPIPPPERQTELCLDDFSENVSLARAFAKLMHTESQSNG